MNEYNAVRRRHPSVKIADLKVDSPVFFRGLIEELAVKRWITGLFLIGLGALLLEEPAVVRTLQKSIESAFASDDLSDFRQAELLQASSADELDYLRSFFPELQAPAHLEDLHTFKDILVKQPEALPVAKSDVAVMKRAVTHCIKLLRQSLPQGNESALTSAMLYEAQLDRCQTETSPRPRRFLKKLGLFTSPNQRYVSVETRLAEWRGN